MKVWIQKPISEPPEKTGWYGAIDSTGEIYGAKFNKSKNKWFSDSEEEEEPTHYLVPAEGHFLTNEELEKKISDAWDAAEKRVKHENTKYPDAFNFTINEKITPNKAEYLKSIK